MKSTHISLPASLLKIINSIDQCRQMDIATIIGLIRESGFIREDFLPFSKFDHPDNESYGRNRIYEGKNFSVYIMSWSPGDFTAIHSHGMAEWGAVFFLGDMDHRLYRVNGKSIELVEKSVVPAGTIAAVKGNLVHAMGNLNQDFVMSLHIYGWNKPESNANDNSSVYELEKKLIRTTNGSAFLNISEELCKSTNNGISTNRETITDYLPLILPFYMKNNNHTMVDYIRQVLLNPDIYLK